MTDSEKLKQYDLILSIQNKFFNKNSSKMINHRFEQLIGFENKNID